MYLSPFSPSASLFSPAGCLADPALSSSDSISSWSIALPDCSTAADSAAADSAWPGFDVRAYSEVGTLRPVDATLGTLLDDLVWVGVLGPS